MGDYTLSARITGDSSSFQRAFEAARNSLDTLSGRLDSMSGKLSSFSKSFAPISTAAVGVLGATGKMALGFEDNMANINTLLDDSSHLDSYESAVKRISNDTGLSLDNMSSGMYQAISSLGDGGEETNKIFETMARSAKAGGAEVSDSVALISAGMKGYNQVNAETAQKISDLAFQTAKLGVTTFPEMAKSMQPLFPLADSLNISYEELFGSMATLTGVTGNTAEVSTQLKAIMGGLMTPTSAMGDLISKYGYANGAAMLESEGLAGVLQLLQTETGGQSDKLAQLFGSQEAIVAMTALTGSQFDTFNDKLAQMSNATGATDAAYQKLITNGDILRNTFNKVKNAGVELGSTLIDMIAPGIEMVGNKVSQFTDWFSQADDSVKRLIVTVLSIVAAITPALMVMSKLASGLSFVVSPIGIVVTAIAALAAGFAYLMNTNQAFHDRVLVLWDEVSSKVSSVAAMIKPILSGLFDGLLAGIQNLSPAFSAIFQTIGSVIGILADAFKGFFSGLSNGFTSGLSSAGGFQAAFTTILGLICPPLKAILLLFQNFAPQIQTLVTSIGSSLVPVFTTLGTTIGGIASAVIPAIQSAMANLIPVIAAIITAVTQIITSVLPVVISLINQIAPFLVQIAQMIGQIMAALAPMIAQLIGALLPVITNIVTVVMNVITAIMPALISILNVVMSVIQAIVPVITNILSVVISVISGIISAINPIISFIGGVISAIMAIISPIVTFVSDVIATIIQVIGTIIGVVTSIFATVFSVISGVFTNVSSFISQVITGISTVISTLTGIVGGVFNGIYSTVSSVMTSVGSFIQGVFSGIQSAWNGLTSFVDGVFSGIGNAVQSLVNTVRGFVNGVIGGINAAVDVINMIPGVSVGYIPYLLHGTDDWSGGFARMNEGGRGELTYLPNGTQVIPHDISVKYAKEAARANASAGANSGGFDYDRLADTMLRALGGIKIENVTSLNGRTLASELTPLINNKLGKQFAREGRG